MRKTFNRLLSFMLSVMMLMSMLPVTAFAAGSADVLDSGDPPKHWLQEYQEYVLEQIANTSPIMTIAASGSASYRMIT